MTSARPQTSIRTPRSAYIHVPFCARRCGYCNFTLVAGRDDLVEPYLAALKRELSWLGTPREVDTLFFGGGTPTQLKGDQLRRLFETVLAWHPLAAGSEFSVEANPADINDETAATLAGFGVTRVSLGAQSFNDAKLRILERDHTSYDIREAVKALRQYPFDLSLDLIFAAPGETLDDWHADLAAAIALAPDHISTYGLTFERGTTFWNRRLHGELQQADEELERAMYETAIDTFTSAGFEHYEVSNFARPGHRCRHNERYWLGEEYYAAGPGAARYVGGVRSTNHRSTTTYIDRVLRGDSPVVEEERLSPPDRARELLVFVLRRLEGVSRDWFHDRTGLHLDDLIGEPLRRFVELGLLTDDGSHIKLTREGLLVSDSLWGEFLASSTQSAPSPSTAAAPPAPSRSHPRSDNSPARR
jgi:oxygen-independent coproporphyrinogen-3 oxidase